MADEMRISDAYIDDLLRDCRRHMTKWPGGESGGVSKIRLFKLDPRVLHSVLVEVQNSRIATLQVDSFPKPVAEGVS